MLFPENLIIKLAEIVGIWQLIVIYFVPAIIVMIIIFRINGKDDETPISVVSALSLIIGLCWPLLIIAGLFVGIVYVISSIPRFVDFIIPEWGEVSEESSEDRYMKVEKET